MNINRLVIAVTGASGSIYAKALLNYLEKADRIDEVALIFSENGKAVWEYELGNIPQFQTKVRLVQNYNMFDSVASGSAQYGAMVVVPCSMGTLGRIAHGSSENLICRAADVMLKERRQLVLVTREAPLSLIHIENMRAVTLAGGIICPASPSFYALPQTLDQVVHSVVHRVIDLLGLPSDSPRWGEK